MYLPSLFSFQGVSLIVGVFNGEGPPVPIPNTEVKLTSADDTCLATDRENRSMPTLSRSRNRSALFFARVIIHIAQKTDEKVVKLPTCDFSSDILEY